MVFHAYMKETREISDLLDHARITGEGKFYNTYRAYMSLAFEYIHKLPDAKLKEYYIKQYDIIEQNYLEGEKHGL